MRVTAEDPLKLPPIVKEIVGVDKERLGATVLAYNYLWQIACGDQNVALARTIDLLVEKHSWLELPIFLGQSEITPLQRIRLSIEKDKQLLLAKGLNPCADYNLN